MIRRKHWLITVVAMSWSLAGCAYVTYDQRYRPVDVHVRVSDAREESVLVWIPEVEHASSNYLLSGSHPGCRFKAKFFAGIGFSPEDWPLLQHEIRQVAVAGQVQLVRESAFGRKYLVLGAVTGPQGRTADVATIWIIRSGDDTPRAPKCPRAGYARTTQEDLTADQLRILARIVREEFK